MDIDIKLKPVWFSRIPQIKITLGGYVNELNLTEGITIPISYTATEGNHRLQIEFYGKTDADTDIVNNKDTAVIIEEIKFNGISSPKFAWAGIYRPTYPPHVTGEPELKFVTYLGWNGIWSLDFTLPIYTWIHKTENLGWIYD